MPFLPAGWCQEAGNRWEKPDRFLNTKDNNNNNKKKASGRSFSWRAAWWDFRPVNPQQKFTFGDVLPVDADVLVTVTPVVLMVEAQRVQQLVLDDAAVHAAVDGQRERLLPAVPAHRRPAPGRQRRPSDRWCSPVYSSG